MFITNTKNLNFYGAPNINRNVFTHLPQKITPALLSGLTLASGIDAVMEQIDDSCRAATEFRIKKDAAEIKKYKSIKQKLSDWTYIYDDNSCPMLREEISTLKSAYFRNDLMDLLLKKLQILDFIHAFADASERGKFPPSEEVAATFDFFDENFDKLQSYEEVLKLPLREFNLYITDILKENSIDKIKFFVENEDLKMLLDEGCVDIMPYRTCDIISARNITREHCENAVKETEERVHDAGLEKNKEVFGDFFVWSSLKNAGMINQKDFDNHVNAVKYLYSKTDANIAQLIISHINEDSEDIFITKPYNLDIAIKYTEQAIDDFDGEFLQKILKTDFDINKNAKILLSILKDKDKVIKAIKAKSMGTDHSIVKWTEEFLNGEDSKNLMFIKNLDEQNLIDALYGISKLMYCINNKPEDYITGKYSSSMVFALKEMLMYGYAITDFEYLSRNELEQLSRANYQIVSGFVQKYEEILQALFATDLETVKLLLDGRLNQFPIKLLEMEKITPSYKAILSDMIRNGRNVNKNGKYVKLSGTQKLALVDIVSNYSNMDRMLGYKIDFDKYKTPIDDKTYFLDMDKMNSDLLCFIYKSLGMSEEDIKNIEAKGLHWDKKYISHFLDEKILNNDAFRTLFREASLGRFAEFINNPSNKYGLANQKTKNDFECSGLNFEVWSKGINEHRFTVNGEDYTVKLWNRIPQESIFDGEYTTCCTALSESKGDSMPNYMLHKAINVVELKNSAGKTIGMSRCFVAKLKRGKPALIIENAEFNNGFINKMIKESSTSEILDNMLEYIKDFATEVGGEKMPVYMSTTNYKIDGSNFAKYNDKSLYLTLLGNVSADNLYFNVFPDSIEPVLFKDKKVKLNVIRE